jgi:glycosyltransferase involved in cell wall biosynthesis
VTVVIPTCNRASLVTTAIESALQQTFRDIEVVVVDDCSDDETPAVVSALLQDPRVRYLRQQVRRGAPAARNEAIRRSSGEFVAFLDDDDEWRPEKLAAQVEVFRRGGPDVGVVYSSYEVVDRKSGHVVGRKVAEKRGELARDLLERNVVGSSSCVVVRRTALEAAGLWDERLPSFQDYDLWIRLSRFVRFDFVEEDLLVYSVHPKKIWTDLGALDRGIEVLLDKHGASRALRANLSVQSLGIGVQYFSRGESRPGRRAILRAIRLAPWTPRPHLNLLLSFLGPAVFRRAHEAKKKFGPPETRSVPSEAPPPAAPEEIGR